MKLRFLLWSPLPDLLEPIHKPCHLSAKLGQLDPVFSFQKAFITVAEARALRIVFCKILNQTAGSTRKLFTEMFLDMISESFCQDGKVVAPGSRLQDRLQVQLDCMAVCEQ